MRRRWRTLLPAIPILILTSNYLISRPQQEDVFIEPIRPAISPSDCSFLQDPNEFTYDLERGYTRRSSETQSVSLYIYGLAADNSGYSSPVDAGSIPRKNLIDDAIFNRMAAVGIQSSPIASDVEFLRRATLDLTGRIPAPADLDAFIANTSAAKRDALIDSLVGTPEFVDKWTMFFGDLYKNNANATNVQRYTQGRDAFYTYIKDAVAANKPYNVMAREIIASTGDSFVNGPVNWVVGGTIPMGPVQDTYDGQAVNLAAMFMGINAVDCLLCHDGARHLDEVNLWGGSQTRQNMWGLSAYFARTRIARQVVTPIPFVAKSIVSNLAAGAYRLNTTTGNRSPRQPINGISTIAPLYPFVGNIGSGILPGETYRDGLARVLTADLQFSRAAVNYIWEKFMVEAFVSPSNSFDLARLDPNNPPPAPWTHQPTNPQLLDSLARWFQQNNYDVRALIKLITKSSAYQLSAVYPGTWDVSYVPYYARKYVRRLDSEEVHDAIVKATGVPTNYTFDYLPPAQWAMQLPDTREPRRAGGGVTPFLDAFGRGDRDLSPRRSDGSVSQTLAMMNNTFVSSRIHQNNAGSRVAALLAQNLDPASIIRQLFLSTLSRPATDQEIALFMPMFQQQGNRLAAEGLQWVLLNKLDFIFNY